MINMQIILIAPNVSNQMGGEAMKALQIYNNIKAILPNTIQIVHNRNYKVIVNDLKLEDVLFVHDDWFMVFLYRSKILSMFCDVWFSYKAIKLANEYIKSLRLNKQHVIIHQTEPNSPVLPRCLSSYALNVFGPINGNIYYPEIFHSRETLIAKFRRKTHFFFQSVNRLLFSGIRRCDLVFVAGGDRTKKSLLQAGCDEKKLLETLDCGIADKFLDRPRISHKGQNLKFVQYGRLVFHKCTFLVIQALARTKLPITFDVVGVGPELENCKRLVKELSLETRVNFIPWYASHDDLLNSLANYRAMVFPSIEDANGIVVQESMALGLPVISLDWGGPQLLIEHTVDGFLIGTDSMETILNGLASSMDKLADDFVLAESFSVNGRDKAQEWRWSNLADKWAEEYRKLLHAS
jgi:glycosyltransferase involved in cell wall biosynthesis